MARLDEAVELVERMQEQTWKGSVDKGEGITDRAIANELWHFARMEYDPALTLGTYAVSCAASLYFGADFQLTDSVDSACGCARWIVEAIDSLLSNRSQMHVGTADEYRRLWVDPVMQRELRKQQSDLAMIRRSPKRTESLARRMRAESDRIGQLMLGEFESEAQTRLTSGPRRRIFPDRRGDPPL